MADDAVAAPAADHRSLTVDIVVAFLAHNKLDPNGVTGLIKEVHASIAALSNSPVEPELLTPAVPIKKSVAPEAVTCLEDGRRFKSLKRHLKTSHGLTPAEYRSKWKLPADYPMVAPAYATQRSKLAKSLGLGRKPAAEPATDTKSAAPASQSKAAKRPQAKKVAPKKKKAP